MNFLLLSSQTSSHLRLTLMSHFESEFSSSFFTDFITLAADTQRGGWFLDEQICGCSSALPRCSRPLGRSDHRSADERCCRRWCLHSAYNDSCLTCGTGHSSLLVVIEGPIGTGFFGSIQSRGAESSALAESSNYRNNHSTNCHHYVDYRKNDRETKIHHRFVQSC